jgi:cobalt/nickel transport system permease protein
MSTLPDWMKEAPDAQPAPGNVRVRKKSFVRKTLDGIFSFFEETFTSEELSRRKGLLQGLDPRAKLLSAIVLIVALSLTKDLRVLAIAYVLTLALACASRVDAGYFIKRVWLFIPIFAGVIALPMIFNVFMPGDPLLAVAPGLFITKQGLAGAATFTMRVAVCVSAAVLLFLTTPRDSLFKSLRSVGVPKVYVMTLDMCYRYIFLFMDMMKDFYTARRSRTIKSMPVLEEQKWVGGRIGHMLARSIDIGERVHQAMVSRGFKGDVKLMDSFHMRAKDYAAVSTALVSGLALVLLSQNIIRL